MCDNLEFPSVKSSIIFTVHRIQSDTNIKLVKSRVCKGRFFNFCRFMCFTAAKKTCHIDFPEKRAPIKVKHLLPVCQVSQNFAEGNEKH